MTMSRREPGLKRVFEEFYVSTTAPDAESLQRLVAKYPQYREELLDYASFWLTSPKPTEAEVAAQSVSEQEALEIQSELMGLLYRFNQDKAGAPDANVQQALAALTAIRGDKEIGKLVKALDLEDARLAAIEFLQDGFLEDPRKLVRKLASYVNQTMAAVSNALPLYRIASAGQFSKADQKPEMSKKRSWAEAIAELKVSPKRKAELLAMLADDSE